MIVSDGVASVVASKQARGADDVAIAMATPVIDPFKYKMGKAGQVSSDADAISKRLFSESGADLGQSKAEALDGQTPDEAAVERVAAQTVQAIEKRSDHAAPMIEAVSGVSHVPAVQTALQKDSTPAGALAQRQQSDAPALAQEVGAVSQSLNQVRKSGPGGKMRKPDKPVPPAEVHKASKLNAYFAAKNTLKGAQADLQDAINEQKPPAQIQTLQAEVDAANEEVMRFDDMLLPRRDDTPMKHISKSMKSQKAYTHSDQYKEDARDSRRKKKVKSKKASKAKQQVARAEALDRADDAKTQAAKPGGKKFKKDKRVVLSQKAIKVKPQKTKKTTPTDTSKTKRRKAQEEMAKSVGAKSVSSGTKKKATAGTKKKAGTPTRQKSKASVTSEIKDRVGTGKKHTIKAIKTLPTYAATDQSKDDARASRREKTVDKRKQSKDKTRRLWRRVDLNVKPHWQKTAIA